MVCLTDWLLDVMMFWWLNVISSEEIVLDVMVFAKYKYNEKGMSEYRGCCPQLILKQCRETMTMDEWSSPQFLIDRNVELNVFSLKEWLLVALFGGYILNDVLSEAFGRWSTSKNVLNDVGEAESTKHDTTLNSILCLGNVCIGERLVGSHTVGIDEGLSQAEALSSPRFNIKVLPVIGGEAVCALHLLWLATDVWPLLVVKRL